MNLKEKYSGKIVTLVGSPASGKTYLGNILKEKLGATMLCEQPEQGFPEQIKSNLKNKVNLFETILFFRNIQIENHLKAIDLSKSNKTVIIDTPFYQNQLFIDLYIDSQFSRDVLYKMGSYDMLVYEPSDVTIYISTTTALVKEFLNKRYGEKDWENDSWSAFISQMPTYVDLHINKIQQHLSNLIILSRELYDFSNDSDRNKLYLLMNNVDI